MFLQDYDVADCDNHELSSRVFKQNVEFARKQDGLFNIAAMTDQYAQYSKDKNPYLYYSLQSAIVSIGTHIFYSYFFSSGTYELGGKPDYISISSITGVNLTTDVNDYNFEYIPERWSDVNNVVDKPWYCPIILEVPQLETGTLTLQTLDCDIYSQLLQMTPTLAAQTEQNVADVVTWLISKLDPVFSGTTFGCSANSLSPDGGNSLYPTESQNDNSNSTCYDESNLYNENILSYRSKMNNTLL